MKAEVSCLILISADFLVNKYLDLVSCQGFVTVDLDLVCVKQSTLLDPRGNFQGSSNFSLPVLNDDRIQTFGLRVLRRFKYKLATFDHVAVRSYVAQ